jgi:uncharacterized Ntn-hydrolase superfamily protein
MTYSIVAFDPKLQQLGVAVQSHSLSCGSTVPWVEAGVGAIATQARSDAAYGYLGLVMLRAGKTAEQTLKAMVASDSHAEIRQVAVVDVQGNVAVHTGAKCIAAAGHQQGQHYSVQANIVLQGTVWIAMAEAFESTEGDLAQRMMAALVAAQAEGGDKRGQQSAALRVVSADTSCTPWERVFDLRVDDHPEALDALQQLLTKARSRQYRQNAVNLLLDRSLGEQRFEQADRAFKTSMQLLSLVDDNPEEMFWYAVTLVCESKVEDALPLFTEVFAKEQKWRDLILHLVQTDHLPNDAQIIEQIIQLK